jgi:hypothetical protein
MAVVFTGAVSTYGVLLLLSSWRVAVHCRARATAASSIRKRVFHGLVAGFSAARLSAAVLAATRDAAWPRVEFELMSLGTLLFFLQFLVVLTKWATATSASNSARAHCIVLVARIAGAIVTASGAVLAVLAVMLPMAVSPPNSDPKNASTSTAAPTLPDAATLHTCEYQYQTSLGLSVEILGAISCLILCAGFVYYGYRLRSRVWRLSTMHADRLQLGGDTSDHSDTNAAAMRIVSEVSAQRRKLVGNAGCLIYLYGLISTLLFLGRAAVLVLLVVHPMCCGDLEDVDGCLDVSGGQLIFELFSKWVPEVVPTLLMMHLMWSPGSGRTSASFKRVRLSKIIRKSRVPHSGIANARNIGRGGREREERGRRRGQGEGRGRNSDRKKSLREGLLGAAHMEEGGLETKQPRRGGGHHVIRSDLRELYRSISTESTSSSASSCSSSSEHQGYLGSSILRVPLADAQSQPFLGAVDFYRRRHTFIEPTFNNVNAFSSSAAQSELRSATAPAATAGGHGRRQQGDEVRKAYTAVRRLNRSHLGMDDAFCKGSIHYRAYEYSQPATKVEARAKATATPAAAPQPTRLLLVEQLAEAPCLFAVPHQLIRLLLRDQRHHLDVVSRSIRNFAKDSLRAFEDRAGSKVNLGIPMDSGSGGGGGGGGGGAEAGRDGRDIVVSSAKRKVGDMYENALAMIKEDAEEREMTEWLFERERELRTYVADMETALRELEHATTRGSILVDTAKLNALEPRMSGQTAQPASASPHVVHSDHPRYSMADASPQVVRVRLRSGSSSPFFGGKSTASSAVALSSPLLPTAHARTPTPTSRRTPPSGVKKMSPFSFKPSSTKAMHKLRFLPTNLHLHDCFVTAWPTSTAQVHVPTSAIGTPSVCRAYSTVTCGAPAAHCYGFKDGKGVRQLQQALAGARRRMRRESHPGENISGSLPQNSTMGSMFGAPAAAGVGSLRPLSHSALLSMPAYDNTTALRSTRSSQCVESIECHKLEWEIKKRTDVAWIQATTQLVATFCRQLDSVLACGDDHSAVMILSQWFEIGFLAGFESLLSTSGQESGMLGDADAAISKLGEIQLFLLTEEEEEEEEEGETGSGAEDEEGGEEGESKRHRADGGDSTSTRFGRVAYERGFKLTSGSLSLKKPKSSHRSDSPRQPASLIKGLDDSDSDTEEGGGGSGSGAASSILDEAAKRDATRENLRQLSSPKLTAFAGPFTDPNGKPVFNVTVRLSASVPQIVRDVFEGASARRTIKVVPVLFTQGVNERQTAANYLPMGLMGDSYLQHEINVEGTQRLTAYFRSYDGFVSRNPLGSNGGHGSCSKRTVAQWYTTEELRQQLHCLTAAVRETKVSVKNIKILLLAQVLCRGLNGGRVTMCKSGKDRTAMSVTLEQARLLVSQHGVPAVAVGALVEAFRRDGVRRDCVLKNVGVTCYAFNRLQRALLPRELQAPEVTCGVAAS